MAIQFFANQLKYTGKGPLDPKALVKTYADLLSVDTWTANGTFCAYNGMIVSVWLDKDNPDNNGVYYLFDSAVTKPIQKPDVANSANWYKLSGGVDTSELEQSILNLEKTLYGVPADEQAGTEAIIGVVDKISDIENIIGVVATEDTPATGIYAEIEDAKAEVLATITEYVDDNFIKTSDRENIIQAAVESAKEYTDSRTIGYVYNKETDTVGIDYSDIAITAVNDITISSSNSIIVASPTITFTDGSEVSIGTSKVATEKYVTAIIADKADKATTLAGYGITDTYTKNEINAIIGTAGKPELKNAEGEIIQAKVEGTGIYAQVYSKEEINALLADIEGGSTESAASVARDLDAYKSSNNQRVSTLELTIGVARNGDEPATGLHLAVENAQASAQAANNKLEGIETTVIAAIEEAKEDILAIIPTEYILPVATETTLGGIKSASMIKETVDDTIIEKPVANNVYIDDDGIASVKAIDVNTLVQAAGAVIVLNGGGANGWS